MITNKTGNSASFAIGKDQTRELVKNIVVISRHYRVAKSAMKKRNQENWMMLTTSFEKKKNKNSSQQLFAFLS